MSDQTETTLRHEPRLRTEADAEYRPGNVERQADRLDTLVQEAHDRAWRLEARLAPVRLIAPEVAGDSDPDVTPSRSELADRLASACEGLEQLVVRLGNLHDEVDL